MKKIILLPVLVFILFMKTNAQKPALNSSMVSYTVSPVLLTSSYPDPVKDYDYYLKKKKNNLTAGLVTLGAGVVFSGLGVIIASNTSAFEDDATAPAIFLIAGGVSGIVSIPLMIMSTVYGRKAKLQLSNQKTGLGLPPHRISDNIRGVSMIISIER